MAKSTTFSFASLAELARRIVHRWVAVTPQQGRPHLVWVADVTEDSRGFWLYGYTPDGREGLWDTTTLRLVSQTTHPTFRAPRNWDGDPRPYTRYSSE